MIVSDDRFAYTYTHSSFDQASPHAIGVGSQADLSDLKVKNEGE